VLQRLQCRETGPIAAAPVTAVMLHVLSTNNSAINFYSNKKFQLVICEIQSEYLKHFCIGSECHSIDNQTIMLQILIEKYFEPEK